MYVMTLWLDLLCVILSLLLQGLTLRWLSVLLVVVVVVSTCSLLVILCMRQVQVLGPCWGEALVALCMLAHSYVLCIPLSGCAGCWWWSAAVKVVVLWARELCGIAHHATRHVLSGRSVSVCTASLPAAARPEFDHNDIVLHNLNTV